MGLFSYIFTKLHDLYRPLGEELFRIIYSSKTRLYQHFQGPSPIFPIGNLDLLWNYKTNPWVGSMELAKLYGEVFVLWVFNRPSIWINEPAVIQQVMSDPEVFWKDTPCAELLPILGETDPFSHVGREWEQLVKDYGIYLPASREKWIPMQVPAIRDVTIHFVESLLKQCEFKKEVSIVENCLKLAQDAIVYCSTSHYPTHQQYRDWIEQSQYGDKRIKEKKKRIPLSPFFYYQRWRLRSSYQALIADSLQYPNHLHVSLANFLQEHRHYKPFVGEEISEMLFGGAFSVGSTIGHCMFHLSKYPKYLIRLREEVSQFKNWDFQTIKDAVFLDAVVREAGRLTSVVPFWTRTSPKDREIKLENGLVCPPNTMLFLSNYKTMLSSNRFAEASQFRPERWLEEKFRTENEYGSAYYFPQGQGPRICKGFHFAWLIHRVALAQLILLVDLETTASELGFEYFFGTNVPLAPKGRFIKYDPKKYI